MAPLAQGGFPFVQDLNSETKSRGRNRSDETWHGAFSMAYADQNEKDHAALVRAVRQGKVQAVVEDVT